MTNLLRNGGFESDWLDESSHRCVVYPAVGGPYEAVRDSVFTPPGWTTWFRHGLPVEHDPENTIGWAEPEARDTSSKNPDRMHSGEKGFLLFTFFRIHDAGLFQQVQVAPGTQLRLSAWAHAWSNQDDDPKTSVGAPGPFYAEEGDPDVSSDQRNFTFWVGIDPTGGTDPFADTVVWGKGAHIYNAYHEVPAVEAMAQGNTVTVFLRSRTLWPFKHNDAYWDDMVLEAVSEPVPPAPEEGGWEYPVIGRGSKLGIHAIMPAQSLSYIQFMRDHGSFLPVVKAVDDLDWLQDVRRISPNTITIARVTSALESCGNVESPSADLDRMATDLLTIIADRIAANPALRDAVDYWEICNEPDPPSTEGYRRLSLLMIRCMERAEARNLRLALFALNAGTPEWDEMRAMVETGVFGRAWQGGHIMTWHEGVFGTDQPIDLYWGDLIPGSPEVAGAGALCFRYRYLYHLLEQRGEVVPLVVSEFYAGGGYQGQVSPAAVVERMRWYDERAREDYYVLGFCPFTLGPMAQWDKTNYDFAYPALLAYANDIKDEHNALPPAPASPDSGRGAPREQYDRTIVLLPPDQDYGVLAEIADVLGFNRWTVGASADDGGIGDLDTRRVIALQPDRWGDLQSFYSEYYSGVELLPLRYETIYQLRGRLLGQALRQRGLSLAWPTTNTSGTITSEFGALESFRNGRDHVGLDLKSSWDEWGDEILSATNGEVVEAGYNANRGGFGYRVRIRSTLGDGTVALIRYAHLAGSDGVYVREGDTVESGDKLGRPGRTGVATGDHLHIDVAMSGLGYADPEILLQRPQIVPPVEIRKVPLGLHDNGGLHWMADHGIRGPGLALAVVRDQPVELDFTRYADAGLNVILRLGWGYADGSGTIPPPGELNVWIEAMAHTINFARGVALFQICNEINNPGEWPGGYPNPSYVVSPEYFVDAYNAICNRVVTGAQMTPGALDPYNVVAQEFGIAGDPATWARYIYENAVRVDWIALHAKTQGADPRQCNPATPEGNAIFADAPLIGRYMNLRTVEDQLSWIPAVDLPIIVTELNPQRRYDGSLGWDRDGADWVRAAMDYLATLPLDGAVLYRYDIAGGGQEPFGLSGRQDILDTLI